LVGYWLGEPLVDLLQIDHVHHASFTGKVADIIVDGGWNFPAYLLPHVSTLLASVVHPVLHFSDTLVWPHSLDGNLSTKQAMDVLKPIAPLLPWADLI